MARTARKVLKTKTLPKGQIVRMISKQVGVPQYKVDEILETFFFILKNAMLTGFRVKWKKFGIFDIKARKGMPKRKYYNMQTGTYYETEAQENYCLPTVRFSPYFVEELKEKTLGFIIEDEKDDDMEGEENATDI